MLENGRRKQNRISAALLTSSPPLSGALPPFLGNSSNSSGSGSAGDGGRFVTLSQVGQEADGSEGSDGYGGGGRWFDLEGYEREEGM
jgi:hypothetical protein